MTERTEGMEQPTTHSAEVIDSPAVQQSPEMTAYPYVYAIGTVEPRFPTLALEKEFAQFNGLAGATAGLNDR